ncbi:hypothetical protein [Streptomyces sp. NPDC088794]|uniref:hypothetical protein n=1 Tax=Streptomyces sp. NPDC088794 TaxID=3365902 RepID=UPI0037FC0DFD
MNCEPEPELPRSDLLRPELPRPELLRPEAAIPLAPLPGLKGVARRYGTGLKGPEFAEAQLVGAGWAAVPVVVALVGLLVPGVRSAALVCAVVLGAAVLARSLLLVVFERRQHAYEPCWLADRTADLRTHHFPLLRCAVRSDEVPGPPEVYDLTRGNQVGELLRRRERDRTVGTFSQATLQFVCAVGRDELAVLAEVRRELAELDFQPVRPGTPQAWVRFPAASYLALPDTGRRPARRAYWVLSGPVLVSAVEATARAGSAR